MRSLYPSGTGKRWVLSSQWRSLDIFGDDALAHIATKRLSSWTAARHRGAGPSPLPNFAGRHAPHRSLPATRSACAHAAPPSIEDEDRLASSFGGKDVDVDTAPPMSSSIIVFRRRLLHSFIPLGSIA